MLSRPGSFLGPSLNACSSCPRSAAQPLAGASPRCRPGRPPPPPVAYPNKTTGAWFNRIHQLPSPSPWPVSPALLQIKDVR
ncbi:hypothetical protein BRADI_4g04132v3 [Brachypodium distachyon]|uniref:Uncharacterized protein n=1 Tax=Brachypodium distachyon TaxID=15368 RepID=A0A0Q3HDI3_BRADI|nr:hypothetical protein BRADI_4g04132v3 [Brachypodium distachyon]